MIPNIGERSYIFDLINNLWTNILHVFTFKHYIYLCEMCVKIANIFNTLKIKNIQTDKLYRKHFC